MNGRLIITIFCLFFPTQCTGDLACSLDIPHGYITGCVTLTTGTVCPYSCDIGYEKDHVNSWLTCSASGTWVPAFGTWVPAFSWASVDTVGNLCTRQTTTTAASILCPIVIPNGRMVSNCSRTVYSTCSVVCDYGCVRMLPNPLICGESGVWFDEYFACNCSDYVVVRLVNGTGPWNGRVEVYYSGEWGTVCDDYFDSNAEAVVICKMLGYTKYWYPLVHRNAYYGEGRGKIILHELHCSGDEDSIANCRSKPWFQHDCTHSEDVGVDCLAETYHSTTASYPHWTTKPYKMQNGDKYAQAISSYTIGVIIAGITSVVAILICVFVSVCVRRLRRKRMANSRSETQRRYNQQATHPGARAASSTESSGGQTGISSPIYLLPNTSMHQAVHYTASQSSCSLVPPTTPMNGLTYTDAPPAYSSIASVKPEEYLPPPSYEEAISNPTN